MTNFPTSVAAEVTTLRDGLAVLDPVESQAEAIDDIRALEELKAACAAAQARRSAELEALRHQEEKARGVAKARRGSGLAAEVGLARGQSPARGTKCVQVAGVLVYEMPNTMAALTGGQISEEHAQVVVKETAWLSPEHRGAVDALIAGQFEGLGPRKLAAKVRAHAERLDQHGAVKRHEKAASERRVSVRPAADGMAYVTALLPTQQAIGVYATLTRDATSLVATGDTEDPNDPTGQPRNRDQVMADLFVQRVTGQAVARAVPAAVQLVMTDAALFGEGETPAWITGHGPIPAELARQWIATPQAEVLLRRVFTRPENGQLASMDSRDRSFPPNLRRMTIIRDDTCRTPYCDAPIRDIDHVVPLRQGGPTSWENASGLCAACNQIKENIGWRHRSTPERLSVTTPTGHQYVKDAGPVLPGMPPDQRQPPDELPLPEVRTSTECYAITTTKWTATLRIAA